MTPATPVTPASVSPWRAEDEALLERLEDEEVLTRLWRYHVGPPGEASPPHPRASGMIRLLRAQPGGERARAAALLSADLAPLAALFEAKSVAELPPELLHHLALYYGKVADVIETHGSGAEWSTGSRVRALACWIALADEAAYLASLARDIGGGALPDVEIERIARDAAVERIDDLGRVAQTGARELSTLGRAAMRALGRIADACKLAGARPESAARAKRRAESRRAAAIEAALQPLVEQLADAAAQNVSVARAPQILRRAVPVWAWAEYDAAVEHFVVDKVTDVAWEMYRAREWKTLSSFIAPFQPLVDSLATRVESDPTMLAWAAPCAQMLVFRSEMEPTLERQIAVARRALAVCPSHRNGRLVMASYLCDEAMRVLDAQPAYFLGADARARAEAKIAEAERLYPASSSLAKAKAKLEATRRR